MNSTPNEADVGIYYNDRGRPYLDPMIYAKHITKILNICYYQKNFYVYRHGRWTHWPDDKIKAFLFNYINDVNDQVFNPKVEKDYILYIMRKCYSDKGFNTNRNYINLKNGILKIDNRKLYKHTPKLRSTIQLPFSYDPEAKCPRFKRFLIDLFLGDDEIITVVQELFGYCLSADMEAQKFFILHGGGGNGKSVFCDILRCLVGEENCSALPIKELSQKFSLADIDGKLLNISGENEKDRGKVYNSQQIKAITGGDVLKAERKHKDVFSLKPVCKLVFAANNLPLFNDDSYGFLRRIMVIPFEATFRKEDGTADVHLLEKLKKELPGIFNFALDGLMRLRSNDYKFSHSEKIDKCSFMYGRNMNPYVDFVQNNIMITGDSDDLVRKSDISEAFMQWAKDNGKSELYGISPQKLWREINLVFSQMNKELCTKKSSGVRYVVGVKMIV